MSTFFKLVFKVLPLGILGLTVYREWLTAMYNPGMVANYAHIGGFLGATGFMLWIRKSL